MAREGLARGHAQSVGARFIAPIADLSAPGRDFLKSLVNVCKDGAGVGEQAVIVFAEWPVDKVCLADDILARHKSPFTRVGTVAAIVSHHEVIVRPHNAVNDGRKRIVWVTFVDVWFVQRYPINSDSLSDDADNIARNGDDALHIVHLWVVGVFKDDDITTLRCVKEVGGFIDEDVFLIVQCWFHTRSINAKILDGKAQHKKHQ